MAGWLALAERGGRERERAGAESVYVYRAAAVQVRNGENKDVELPA